MGGSRGRGRSLLWILRLISIGNALSFPKGNRTMWGGVQRKFQGFMRACQPYKIMRKMYWVPSFAIQHAPKPRLVGLLELRRFIQRSDSRTSVEARQLNSTVPSHEPSKEGKPAFCMMSSFVRLTIFYHAYIVPRLVIQDAVTLIPELRLHAIANPAA